MLWDGTVWAVLKHRTDTGVRAGLSETALLGS